MQQNIEDLTTELIRLPKRERLEIVRFLLFLDNRSLDSDDIDSAWEKESSPRRWGCFQVLLLPILPSTSLPRTGAWIETIQDNHAEKLQGESGDTMLI